MTFALAADLGAAKALLMAGMAQGAMDAEAARCPG